MLVHGGDIVGFEERHGVKPIDFSVNTNPLGLAPGARKGLEQAFDRACEYPDPLYRRLRQAIGAHEGVAMDWVLPGNGAADLIWRLAGALKPREGLVLAPTFSEYGAALEAHGCRLRHHVLGEGEGFRLTPSILEDVTPETDLVFVCNPNNPTGLTADPELLDRLLERCESCGAILAVDECFLPFVEGARSMKCRLAEHKNLFILKAFTKIYGMAGLRLGYCLCSDGGLLEKLRLAGQAWPVSVTAEEAGMGALADEAYLRRTLDYLRQERARLKAGMEAAGLTVWPGEANYLFFRSDRPDYQERMARHGILIRSCSNYVGLADGNYFRAAVRTREENDRLLAAMEQER